MSPDDLAVHLTKVPKVLRKHHYSTSLLRHQALIEQEHASRGNEVDDVYPKRYDNPPCTGRAIKITTIWHTLTLRNSDAMWRIVRQLTCRCLL